MIGEVLQRYNKDPSGWKVTVGTDTRGRALMLIQKGTRVWQIKTHHVSPHRAYSLGGKSKAGEPDGSSLPFGWRDMSAGLLARIRADLKNKGELSKEIVDEVSSLDPLVVEDTKKSLLEGPFTISHRPVAPLSPKQEKLDKKLSLELDRLLLKKEGGSMYG